jgi:hypothetical protein
MSDPDSRISFGDDLVLDNGMVYFSLDPGNNKGSSVYAVPVDGSTPAKVLIEGGSYIRLVNGSLTYGTEGKRFVHDLATGTTVPSRVSPHAGDEGFCGAEFTESFETLCMGQRDDEEGVPGRAKDAILTIKETSGRTTVIKPFPNDLVDDPVPDHVVALGPWLGVVLGTEGGGERDFLVDLPAQAIKELPTETTITAVNEDETQMLLWTRHGGSSSTQVIVRIPPTA